MTEDEKRELDQLLLVAESYLRQARRLAFWGRSAKKRLSDINSRHRVGRLQFAERILAHSTSGAIRLSTIADRLNSDANGKRATRYNNQFYKWQKNGKRRELKRTDTSEHIIGEIKQNLDEHIHDLLRDDVGHVENQRPDASDRRTILNELTPREIIEQLSACASKLRKRVRES